MERYFDIEWGWGDVLTRSDNFIVVRFDADPWCLRQIPC